MNKTNGLRSKESKAGADNKWNKWQRRGLKYGLAVVALGVLLLLASQTEIGQFYLTFPTMSRAEFKDIVRNAHEGDAESQLYLGVFYANGDGVWQDYIKAAVWYQKAVDQNNARAQRNLALLYDCGVGVEQDYAKALDLYIKAAKQGDAAAHIGISGFPFAYRHPLFPTWWSTANAWITRACFLAWREYIKDNGSKVNEMALGFEHMEEDAIFGFKRFTLFRPSFFDFTYKNPAPNFWDVYHSGQLYYQKDTALVQAVQKKARRGDSEAQLRMAIFMLHMQGIERIFNPERNMDYWLLKSARKGNERAAFIIADVNSHKNAHTRIRWPRGSAIALGVKDEKKRTDILKDIAFRTVDDYFNYMYLRKYPIYQLAFPGFEVGLTCDEIESESENIASRGLPEAIWDVLITDRKESTLLKYLDYLKIQAAQGSSRAQFELFRYELARVSKPADCGAADIWLKQLLLSQDIRPLRRVQEYIFKTNNFNYDTKELYIERAKSGDSMAKILLGIVCYNEKKYLESMNYFESTASSEWPIAYYYLGALFEQQEGDLKNTSVIENKLFLFREFSNLLSKVTEDRKLALEMYLHGAEAGHLPSNWHATMILKNYENIEEAKSKLVKLFFENSDWYLYAEDSGFDTNSVCIYYEDSLF